MPRTLISGLRRTLGWRAGRLPLAVGITAILVLSGGMVYAAIPNTSDGVIHGCYHKSSGLLRLIDAEADQSCGSSEIPIGWSEEGPQGEPGPAGADGAQGPIGPNWAVAAPLQVNDGTLSIGQGGIDTTLLANGAVTTEKQTATVGTGVVLVQVPPPAVPGTVEYVFSGADSLTKHVSTASITVSGTAAHKVLVTGQAQVTCAASCPAGTHTVNWSLLENGLPVPGSSYTAAMTAGTPFATLPISALRPAVSGVTVYSLEVTINAGGGPSTFVVGSINLTAVDLGR